MSLKSTALGSNLLSSGLRMGCRTSYTLHFMLYRFVCILLVLCWLFVLSFDYMVVLLGISTEALICAIFDLLLGYRGIFYSRLRTSGFS